MNHLCPLTDVCHTCDPAQTPHRNYKRIPASAWELYMLALQQHLDPTPDPTTILLPPDGPRYYALHHFATHIYSLSHNLYRSGRWTDPHLYLKLKLDHGTLHPPPDRVFLWGTQS